MSQIIYSGCAGYIGTSFSPHWLCEILRFFTSGGSQYFPFTLQSEIYNRRTMFPPGCRVTQLQTTEPQLTNFCGSFPGFSLCISRLKIYSDNGAFLSFFGVGITFKGYFECLIRPCTYNFLHIYFIPRYIQFGEWFWVTVSRPPVIKSQVYIIASVH